MSLLLNINITYYFILLLTAANFIMTQCQMKPEANTNHISYV